MRALSTTLKPSNMAIVLVAWLLLTVLNGMAQTISIGEHVALPGGAVRVPLEVANAAGLAAVSVTVNYDPSLLTSTNVAVGALGADFALEYRVEEGRVVIAMVREDALLVGGGVLAYLQFVVKPGALPGMTTPLAIADQTASGQYAVSLAGGNAASGAGGSVRIVSPAEDTDEDGLPDWWEELYFEGPTVGDADMDSDDDGLTNLGESIAGTSPVDAGSALKITSVIVQAGLARIEFQSVAGVKYRVLRSADLGGWLPVGGELVGSGSSIEVIDTEGGGVEAGYYRIQAFR